MTQLTTTEVKRLSTLESTIERGLRTFVEVGRALAEIRDSRLYRAEHGTFEAYCKARWGWKRVYAHYLIQSARAADNVHHGEHDGPLTERQARPLTQLENPDDQRAAWGRAQEVAREEGGELRARHVEQAVQERQGGVHFSSETDEWYTPPGIVNAVIALLGAIDLDPCSNSKTEPNVPAAEHFTASDNGETRPWSGRVYMNPPYGREIETWVTKLVREYNAGAVTAAIALVPARTDTRWFQRFRGFPRCFISGRLKFSGQENAAPFPSMVVYLGKDLDRFALEFAPLGAVCHCGMGAIA